MLKFEKFKQKCIVKDALADAFSEVKVGHVCLVTYKPSGRRLRVKRK